ncbi:MAG: hypothetical protein LBC07_03695, partial [Elusimicrobiota bacterium]|nr:hypothetical protein [Elusimicrobiota bacterium]
MRCLEFVLSLAFIIFAAFFFAPKIYAADPTPFDDLLSKYNAGETQEFTSSQDVFFTQDFPQSPQGLKLTISGGFKLIGSTFIVDSQSAEFSTKAFSGLGFNLYYS